MFRDCDTFTFELMALLTTKCCSGFMACCGMTCYRLNLTVLCTSASDLPSCTLAPHFRTAAPRWVRGTGWPDRRADDAATWRHTPPGDSSSRSRSSGIHNARRSALLAAASAHNRAAHPGSGSTTFRGGTRPQFHTPPTRKAPGAR